MEWVEPTTYTLEELRKLWQQYHASVHNLGSGVPCDACPGDPCYATSFFNWLDEREKPKPTPSVVDRIRPLGELT